MASMKSLQSAIPLSGANVDAFIRGRFTPTRNGWTGWRDWLFSTDGVRVIPLK